MCAPIARGFIQALVFQFLNGKNANGKVRNAKCPFETRSSEGMRLIYSDKVNKTSFDAFKGSLRARLGLRKWLSIVAACHMISF